MIMKIAWSPAAAAARAALAATAGDAAPEREPQEEVGEDRDRPDQHADDQREADVEVADVRQLVGDDALELLAVELLEQAGRDRDRRVLRVAAGGEGVRRRVVDDVDLGHRDVRRDRHLLDDVQQLGRRGRSTSRAWLAARTSLSPAKYDADAAQAAEDEREDQDGRRAMRAARPGVADGEAEQPEQGDRPAARAGTSCAGSRRSGRRTSSGPPGRPASGRSAQGQVDVRDGLRPRAPRRRTRA